MKEDVKIEILKKIKGMEKEVMIKKGYEIEYEFIDKRELKRRIEKRKV